eukprot:TRINITY_DN68140_c6_g1_i1.p1 TRINITY_DN68140_c6_g1~~TRINITY_DN68140_c6_g1_i1.p1  ORF type:complete len:483 (-),score=59.53 TRINITY_DN68140_c6_g1_i1:85-1338(-)
MVIHNLCSARLHPKSPRDDRYTIDVDVVLLRLRFPKFIELAREHFDDNGEVITHEMLTRGRLSKQQILETLRRRFPNLVTVGTAAFQQTFHAMILGGWIKDVPALERPVPDDDKKKEREKAESQKKQQEEEKEPKKKKRKVTFNKEKEDRPHDDEEVESRMYRIHFEHLNLLLRNQIIKKFVEKRIHTNAGKIIKVMLSAPHYTAKKREIADRADIPVETATSYIQLLIQGNFVRPSARSDDEYHVSVMDCVHQIKSAEAANVTHMQYGVLGARILRILLSKKMLEEKQITSLAMASKKDVHVLLYKMMTGGVVQLQEVPRSTERNPKATFYLWYVDPAVLYTHIQNQVLKTIRNLRTKMAHEKTKITGSLPKEALLNPGAVQTAEHRELLEKWTRAETILVYNITGLENFNFVFSL